ncbi:NAD(P)-binding protein [Aureobasidium sp. EXF-3400]|nr:NAD(P)-binding protein [Aureobasidium sp. EXF-3400]
MSERQLQLPRFIMNTFQSILIVGGCGFLGHHIVDHLLARNDDTKIYVMGRSNSQRRRHRVEYLEGDLLDDRSVQSIVIINTVAPITYPLKGTPDFHYKINVEGTANLVRAAIACPNTAAFVYTSSAHTLLETDYLNAKESDPVDESPDGRRYPTTTKAIADRLTRSSNNDLPINAGGLRTACIRPCAMFGENDSQLLLTMLNQLQENRQGYQIGSNSALYDFVYVGNVAEAHIKAAEALVGEAAQGAEPGKQVGGESFFITNDDPRQFYGFMRLVWQATGYDISNLTPTIIPSKVALAAASASDWATWAFTLGGSSSFSPSKEDIEHLCLNRTHDISKARRLLGYSPTVTIEEGTRRGVRSFCYDY